MGRNFSAESLSRYSRSGWLLLGLITALCAAFTPSPANANEPEIRMGEVTWERVKGPDMTGQPGVYGEMGVPDVDNNPGARHGATSWTAPDGSIWLFGGLGTGATFVSSYQRYDSLNDLWRFDPVSNMWSWMKGSYQLEQTGVYGTIGIPAPENTPGARQGAVGWATEDGSLWLFGGSNEHYFPSGRSFNDLWKYNPETGNWTWVHGSQEVAQVGIYGEQGVPADGNTPGGRDSAVSWTDLEGNLWLFGGYGRDAEGFRGYLNDLWKYNPATGQWAWISGSSFRYSTGVFGNLGVPAPENTPDARSGSSVWVSGDGRFWLFGGARSRTYARNDLWCFDPFTGMWTWVGGSLYTNRQGVYGEMGVASMTNIPGGRHGGASWVAVDGSFWLYGGEGRDSENTVGQLGDLWRYDQESNMWVWMRGRRHIHPYREGGFPLNSMIPPIPVFDLLDHEPESRFHSSPAVNRDGNMYLIGGRVPLHHRVFWALGQHIRTESTLIASDLWAIKLPPMITIASSAHGESVANNITSVDFTGNTVAPQGPVASVRWRINDGPWQIADGTAEWSFTASGLIVGENRIDIRAVNPDYTAGDIVTRTITREPEITVADVTWERVKGPNVTDQFGVYGEIGVPDLVNNPGAREDAVAWVGKDGSYWLFGGNRNSTASSSLYADLWNYIPELNAWTWIKGPSHEGRHQAVHGTMGVAAPENDAGGRRGAIGWTAEDGRLWLFGGYGAWNSQDAKRHLNDLWEYDPETTNWTWVHGSPQRDQAGVYGDLGVPSQENVPGGRSGAVSWMDSEGNLWLFGGWGFDRDGIRHSLMNDLWKYTPATREWTWMGGSALGYAAGVPGKLGVPALENTPGARYNSSAWRTEDGRFWLFGGHGLDSSGLRGPLNDLWCFDPSTGMWTWISGTANRNRFGNYGEMGVEDAANSPGGREGAAVWTAADGSLWLYGGYGMDSANGPYYFLRDLWRYAPERNSWTWMGGNHRGVSRNTLGLDRNGPNFQLPDDNPSMRSRAATWAAPNGTFWLFGGTYMTRYIPVAGGLDDPNCASDLWAIKPPPMIAIASPARGASVSNEVSSINVTGNTVAPQGPVASIRWRLNDGPWQIADGTAEWSFTASGLVVGENRIDIRAVNPDYTAGEIQSRTIVRREPAPAPVVAINQPSSDQTVFHEEAFVLFSGMASAPESAVDRVEWRRGTEAWATASGTTNWSFSAPLIVGANTISVRAINSEGTASEIATRTITREPEITVADVTWERVKGPALTNQPGVYGRMGVPHIANNPGARDRAVSWTASDGSTWLFGGDTEVYGLSSFNDLWRYDSATNVWTWMKGSNQMFQRGTYGMRGEAARENTPGAREGAVGWATEDGSLWLFGGSGQGGPGYNNGWLNDLWRYDIETGNWTWVHGSSEIDQAGTYGEQGVAADGNVPAAREQSVSWTDLEGSLWLFGGQGRGVLNDLWKYNPEKGQWTWIGGSITPEMPGNYGDLGVADPENMPGGRYGSSWWKSEDGRVWIFGGRGYDATRHIGQMNDLWCYDPFNGMWTWMGGSPTRDRQGVYGEMGVADTANVPGAREGAASWVAADGSFWLYGGGFHQNTFGIYQDLWRYDPETNIWTWSNGSQLPMPIFNTNVGEFMGGPILNDTPMGRDRASSFVSHDGSLLLYGGVSQIWYNPGLYHTFMKRYASDLWRLHLPLEFTIISPSPDETVQNKVVSLTFAGTVASQGPVASIRWRLNGGLWQLAEGTADWNFTTHLNVGENRIDIRAVNPDYTGSEIVTRIITRLAPAPVVSIHAPDDARFVGNEIHGVAFSGVASAPDSTVEAVRWRLNGGAWRAAEGTDSWRFDTMLSLVGENLVEVQSLNSEGTPSATARRVLTWVVEPVDVLAIWTWLGGEDAGALTPREPVRGTLGVPDPANHPATRAASATWTANDGSLWLFGGRYEVPLVLLETRYRGDLWRYQPEIGQWTWMRGEVRDGVYGTRGVAAPDNTPGARAGVGTWTDTAGNLWLFGGYADFRDGNGGSHNDLWRFDISSNQWTWMSGSRHRRAAGHYGILGEPHPDNTPGARRDPATWLGADGSLYLFGGEGIGASGTTTGHLGDLWKYDSSLDQWVWLDGSNQINPEAMHGAAGNVSTPGGRSGAVTFVGHDGSLWLFGGITSEGRLSDLWRHDPAANQWSWVSGSANVNQPGIFGTQSLPHHTNQPGARSGAGGWVAVDGALWLFAGQGYGAPTTQRGQLNDLWRFSPGSGMWTWMGGSRLPYAQTVRGQRGIPHPDNFPGGRDNIALWTTANSVVWIYGGKSPAISELWRLDVETIVPTPTPTPTPSPTSTPTPTPTVTPTATPTPTPTATPTPTPEPGLPSLLEVLLGIRKGHSVLDENHDGVLDAADIIRLSGPHPTPTPSPTPAPTPTPEPDQITILLPGNVPLELVRIPAGTFVMGSQPDDPEWVGNEGPRTNVTISRSFYMGKYEVTQAQWLAVMGSWPGTAPSPAYGEGPDHPAYNISWNDVQSFITALSAHITETGQSPAALRLPTEAEWEYSCRAGTTTRFYFGDSLNNGSPGVRCDGDPLRNLYMWSCANSNNQAQPVGRKLPNSFGLYDMHGNVSEWCHDIYTSWLPGGSVTDPTGPSTGSDRSIRGGTSRQIARHLRSASRGSNLPSSRSQTRGFRLAATGSE